MQRCTRRFQKFLRFPLSAIVLCFLAAPPLLSGAEVSLDQFMIRRGFAVVPLKHGFKNRFYAEATLDGQPLRCLLDTGTTTALIVDPRKTSGLKPVTGPREAMYTPLATVGTELRFVSLPRLELGDAIFTNYTAVLWDMHKGSQFIRTSSRADDFHMIIGLAFLRAAHAIIGCEGPALYLRGQPLTPAQLENLETSLTASGYSSASFLKNGLPIIRAEVNSKPALLEVDTGSLFTALDLEQVKAFGMTDQVTKGRLTDASQRQRELRFAHVNSIKLAEFDTGPMPVGVADFSGLRQRGKLLQQAALPPLLGYVGPDLLYRSRAIIDCGAGKVYFSHTPAQEKEPRSS